jgi:hypothetical protein
MTTDWFYFWARARYETRAWPLSAYLCRADHSHYWQEIGADLYWCQVCYYHRAS